MQDLERSITFCMFYDVGKRVPFFFCFAIKADGGDQPFLHGQSKDQDQGWRKRRFEEMGGGRADEASNGDKIASYACI